ncbi:MAG: S-layer homology domain-containing protein, partial [Firmicutes bacterium]|nr:S-layer homology domain-containing protein [Bacillota bacterium]
QIANVTYEPIRPGYTFEGWYADPEFTTPVTQVLMDRNHTVYAKWSKTPVPGWLDGDNHIAYLIGYPDGLIQPHWNITRAEVATIFFRLLKEEVRQEYLTSDNSFGDVVEGQWFNTAISTVSSMGIVKGYPDGDFHPNANITRAEFAAIAARFDQLTETNGTYFSDIDGHWAKREICLAAHKGWITGYPDGTFRPNNLATRAEVAALINRVLNRDPASPEDLLEGMVEWPDNMDTGAWYYLDLQESSNTHEYERETKPTEKWTVLLENPDWTIYNH